MTITIYSTPDCNSCNATYRAMEKKGLDYTVVDVTQDPEALDMIRNMGYSSAPVVMAGEDHWSGYRPDKVIELARTTEALSTAA